MHFQLKHMHLLSWCHNNVTSHDSHQEWISSTLQFQEHDSAISFATDAWTSPNSRAYVAVIAHFEHNGVLVLLLLDIVEVVCSHLGINLVAVFAQILEDFGISNKI